MVCVCVFIFLRRMGFMAAMQLMWAMAAMQLLRGMGFMRPTAGVLEFNLSTHLPTYERMDS